MVWGSPLRTNSPQQQGNEGSGSRARCALHIELVYLLPNLSQLFVVNWPYCLGSTRMDHIRTHYDNLKVTRNAPPEVIRAAYKTLSQKFHPDRTPGKADAVRIMAIINASYEVLSDPDKRQEHDLWIAQQERAFVQAIKCLSINKLLAIFQPQAKIRLKPSNNGGLNGTHQNLGNFGCILGDR